MDALDLQFDNSLPTQVEATLKIQDLDRQLQQVKNNTLILFIHLQLRSQVHFTHI